MKIYGKIIEIADGNFYLLTEEGEKLKFVIKKNAPVLSDGKFVLIENLLGYKVTIDYDKKKYKYTKGNTELEGYRHFCNKIIYEESKK